MAEVKRYDANGFGEPDQDGDYVLYSDYAALERRLRIVERTIYLMNMPISAWKAAQLAEREIDAEQKVEAEEKEQEG